MKYLVISVVALFFVGCSCKKELQPQTPLKTSECKPKIVYKDRIIIEEKPIIKEKIVYKDKIIYKDKIVYRDREVKSDSKSRQTQAEFKTSKPIIGRIEYVTIVSAKKRGKAKIDTGAKTTSVDARNIERFERDGKEWVKFKLLGKLIERPLVKNILIKRHGVKAQKRAVVKLRLRMGKVSRNVLVTLADREKYNYPILIGRNFLKDTFVVDVSKKYTLQTSKQDRKSK